MAPDPSAPGDDPGRDHNLWWLGVLCSLLACFGTVSGLILQKYSHMKNEALPPSERRPPLQRPLWWASLFLMIVVPSPLDVASLALAAQSLLAPLAAVTLLLNAILSPCFLGEKLTRVDIWATFLIIVGATLSTSFGDHRERTYDVPGLYVLFERPEFIIFQCITLVSVFVLWLFITRQLRIRKEAKATANIHVESILKTPAQRAVPFACGLLAGLTGSQQNVLTKCFSELFSLTLQGHNQFKYLLTYVLMASAIFFAIFQIGYVSKGLEHFDAVFYLPVYNAFLIVLGIVAGSVYFNEISSASAESVAFFCVGVTITLSGVLLLTQRKKPEEEDEDEDEDEGGATDEGDGSNSDPERSGGLRGRAAAGDPASPGKVGEKDRLLGSAKESMLISTSPRVEVLMEEEDFGGGEDMEDAMRLGEDRAPRD